MPYIKITVCKKKKDRGEIQCSILSSLRVKRKGWENVDDAVD